VESKPYTPRQLHLVQDPAEELGSDRVTPLLVDELVRAALGGLSEAAARFDPERGVDFASYARWWIESALRAAARTTPAEAA
jgi:DNA-directed RNA polymerase specialized sigma subunit